MKCASTCWKFWQSGVTVPPAHIFYANEEKNCIAEKTNFFYIRFQTQLSKIFFNGNIYAIFDWINMKLFILFNILHAKILIFFSKVWGMKILWIKTVFNETVAHKWYFSSYFWLNLILVHICIFCWLFWNNFFCRK